MEAIATTIKVTLTASPYDKNPSASNAFSSLAAKTIHMTPAINKVIGGIKRSNNKVLSIKYKTIVNKIEKTLRYNPYLIEGLSIFIV
jgi:hypothetical protein